MTYASVISAVQSAMQSALTPSPIKTVGQVESMQPSIDPTQAPALLLLEIPGQVKPVSGGFPGGHLEENWDLECHLFAFYQDLSTPDDFRNMLTQIRAIFPSNHFFNHGTADTTTTAVVTAGIFQTVKEMPWQEMNGLIMREGYVRARITEETLG